MFRFQSRATGDLIMLEPNGRHILQILGRTDSADQRKGILLPADMPAAIAALEAAIATEAAQRERLRQEAIEHNEPEPRFEGVSLRQRALPLIDMIRRCQQAEREIVWGV